MAWSQVRPTPPPRGGGYTQVHPQSAWTQVRPNNSGGYRQVGGANAYARKALANLGQRGIVLPHVGGNAAAQWRALSPIAGALKAVQSGRSGSYLGAQGTTGMNPQVAALLMQILQPQHADPYAQVPQRQIPPPPPPVWNPGFQNIGSAGSYGVG